MSRRVKIKAKLIDDVFREYQKLVREYNKKIRESGYYLKPVHIVVKKVNNEVRIYRYYGRYWWRVEYLGKKGGRSIIKWIYIGREKPKGLENPPKNPLEGIVVYKVKGDDEHLYVPLEHYDVLVKKLGSIAGSLKPIRQ